MRKFAALLTLAASLFLSTVSVDGYASGHGGCAESSAISQSADASCACDHLASPPAPEAAHDSAHPCHIGHCSFTLKTFSTAVATADLVGTQPASYSLRIDSGFSSDTLRPPARA